VTDLLEENVAEVVKEPPKRWTNKWRALASAPCPYGCGFTCEAGDVYFSCCGSFFISRDHAETTAAQQIQDDIAEYGEPLDEYLGAYPVDERP
jgi:hypothetical protein